METVPRSYGEKDSYGTMIFQSMPRIHSSQSVNRWENLKSNLKSKPGPVLTPENRLRDGKMRSNTRPIEFRKKVF